MLFDTYKQTLVNRL